MRSQLGVLVLTVVVLAAGCAGPSTVEASVRDAFVDCMGEAGITVENVAVGVPDGRHIETFSWDAVDGEHAEQEVGQECEDMALQMFRVSRS